jgi:hypothetical protein
MLTFDHPTIIAVIERIINDLYLCENLDQDNLFFNTFRSDLIELTFFLIHKRKGIFKINLEFD